MIIIAILLAGLLLCGGGCDECPFDEDPQVDLSAHLCTWRDHPQNPLVGPPPSEFLIGDPTVVIPAESPDGQWHLFANSLMGIHHHTSSDGISWTRRSPALFGISAFRPYIYKEAGTFYLFFEKFSGSINSVIKVSTSTDLFTWSAPSTVLQPSLVWEKERTSTVSNPYLMHRDGKYWLYYSASSVFLADAGINEPKYIGLARADKILGPYVKEPRPLLSPSAADPLRNLGAGSIKLLDHRMGGRWIALNNGIYRDAQGRTRSAIMVLSSEDGLAWESVCAGAVLAPTGAGWKSSFVYAFDTVVMGQEIWAYYNAREGWAPATERIGLSMVDLPCAPP